MNPANATAAATYSPPVGDIILFAIMAAWVVGFALVTITRRNPVTAVMSLVATFFGLAAIYAALSAHFLAVVQVLVYAGAIMVLFIFVVMILNREEVAPLALRPMRLLGVVAAAYLFFVFWKVVSQGVATDVAPPVVPETFGTVASIGDLLFREFLYPFE
ncbi:MAG TPA: NADH-quinone oxidoreductase subunit J, partial [Polyangia bacterium]|nr:NADH-quinone oxidoreductase subunit J [Polyangia bacterium]